MTERRAPREHRIGVISDTHGLVRPEALAALAGSELILHAGDVGGPEVLAALAAIAPVTAVRGNNDRGRWADGLPERATVRVGDATLLMLHDVKELDVDPGAAALSAVVAGHSHRPAIREQGGVLYLNPGSAGPRRFKLPLSVARVVVRGAAVMAEIVEIGDGAA
ncbi:metallophosphoesterase family protein [Sorangium sp. So ce1097]|uniref:metallophosphoesterase family protein n=1 Tax=Sorangium sp. So ce1097 TaxID=3133330 RepID=UPI003F5DC26C